MVIFSHFSPTCRKNRKSWRKLPCRTGVCHIVHVPSGEIRKGSFLVNKKSLPSEDEVMKCVSFLAGKGRGRSVKTHWLQSFEKKPSHYIYTPKKITWNLKWSFLKIPFFFCIPGNCDHCCFHRDLSYAHRDAAATTQAPSRGEQCQAWPVWGRWTARTSAKSSKVGPYQL